MHDVARSPERRRRARSSPHAPGQRPCAAAGTAALPRAATGPSRAVRGPRSPSRDRRPRCRRPSPRPASPCRSLGWVGHRRRCGWTPRSSQQPLRLHPPRRVAHPMQPSPSRSPGRAPAGQPHRPCIDRGLRGLDARGRRRLLLAPCAAPGRPLRRARRKAPSPAPPAQPQRRLRRRGALRETLQIARGRSERGHPGSRAAQAKTRRLHRRRRGGGRHLPPAPPQQKCAPPQRAQRRAHRKSRQQWRWPMPHQTPRQPWTSNQQRSTAA
mmetsp:Transcript_49656/g.165858  ORF Transcript_49656/g.165858 Transcript_49656/m.165858 type:complete len:269 (-) Transcript_49656:1219-2025(-)